MQKQNISEYELLRKELLQVKQCITNYIGYVFTGSGALLFGLTSLNLKEIDKKLTDLNQFIPFVPISISFIITLVLLILFYKFVSHNRMAGYCKLLSYEQFNKTTGSYNPSNDVMSWEICVDKIRLIENNEKEDDELDRSKIITSILPTDAQVEGLNLKLLEHELVNITRIKGECPIDKGKVTKGIRIIIKYLRKGGDSRSWGFPITVTVVFLSICSMLNIFGVYGILTNFMKGRLLTFDFISIIFLFIDLYIWVTFCGKLFCVMKGSDTIDCFCKRFMPSRIHYLNSIGIIPKYELSDLKIE
jgi:hypothetical protein